MKAAEAIQKVGVQLQENYKIKGFKYSKSEKCLIRRTEDFSYLVVLHSVRGNKEGANIRLHVNLTVDCKKKVKDTDISIGQLFYIYFVEHELTTYNIATDELIEKTVKDLISKLDEILIPFIGKLEGENISQYEEEWVKNGFFGNRKGYKFICNLKFIAEVFGKEKAEECLKNFIATLTYEKDKQIFVDTLTGKIEYDPSNFHRSMYGQYSDANELGLKVSI